MYDAMPRGRSTQNIHYPVGKSMRNTHAHWYNAHTIMTSGFKAGIPLCNLTQIHFNVQKRFFEAKIDFVNKILSLYNTYVEMQVLSFLISCVNP